MEHDEDWAILEYRRERNNVRLKIQNFTNHELGAVIAGLWARMDDANRAGMIRELQAQMEPGAWLSPVSKAIAEGERSPGAIDLARYFRSEQEG